MMKNLVLRIIVVVFLLPRPASYGDSYISSLNYLKDCNLDFQSKEEVQPMSVLQALLNVWNRKVDYDIDFTYSLLEKGFQVTETKYAQYGDEFAVTLKRGLDHTMSANSSALLANANVPGDLFIIHPSPYRFQKIAGFSVHFSGQMNTYAVELLPAEGVPVESAYQEARSYFGVEVALVRNSRLHGPQKIIFRKNVKPSFEIDSENAAYTKNVLERLIGEPIITTIEPFTPRIRNRF